MTSDDGAVGEAKFVLVSPKPLHDLTTSPALVFAGHIVTREKYITRAEAFFVFRELIAVLCLSLWLDQAQFRSKFSAIHKICWCLFGSEIGFGELFMKITTVLSHLIFEQLNCSFCEGMSSWTVSGADGMLYAMHFHELFEFRRRECTAVVSMDLLWYSIRSKTTQ